MPSLVDLIADYEARRATAPVATVTAQGHAVMALHHLADALEPLDGEQLGDVLDLAADLLMPSLERAGLWPVTA